MSAALLSHLHPLVQRLVQADAADAVTLEHHADWTARPGEHVLFFSGDAVRFPEAADVAIVLTELQAALGRRFDIGVVPRAEEDALARRWGVQHWPSLVFVREGGYLGCVSGMYDWTDYVAAVQDVLARPVTRAPGIGIPVLAAAPSCH